MGVENLEQRNGYWYDTATQKYYIKENENFIPAISPTSGGTLEPIGNNIFRDKYSQVYCVYYNGLFIPASSPLHGGKLKPVKENLYHDVYTNSYCLYSNGEFIPVKNPFTRTVKNMIPTEDEYVFYDKVSHHKFTYDTKTKNFIPDYIPDCTLNNEPAHLEENYLVGDKTGVKIEIGKNGELLTPTYLKLKEEVEKNTPENGIWKGHKFIYDENKEFHESLMVQVEKENGELEFKQGLESYTYEINIVDSNETVTIDEYDRMLLDKINKKIKEEKIFFQINKMQEQYNKEKKEIEQNANLDAWKITHGISDENIDEKSTNKEYLEKIIFNKKGPSFCEFEIKKDTCYFCLVQTKTINYPNTMNAKAFSYDDKFKEEFLEPYLIKSLSKDGRIYCDTRIVPNEKNSQLCNFYVINYNGDITILKNVDTIYAQDLNSKMNNYQELNNNHENMSMKH